MYMPWNLLDQSSVGSLKAVRCVEGWSRFPIPAAAFPRVAWAVVGLARVGRGMVGLIPLSHLALSRFLGCRCGGFRKGELRRGTAGSALLWSFTGLSEM